VTTGHEFIQVRNLAQFCSQCIEGHLTLKTLRIHSTPTAWPQPPRPASFLFRERRQQAVQLFHVELW